MQYFFVHCEQHVQDMHDLRKEEEHTTKINLLIVTLSAGKTMQSFVDVSLTFLFHYPCVTTHPFSQPPKLHKHIICMHPYVFPTPSYT